MLFGFFLACSLKRSITVVFSSYGASVILNESINALEAGVISSISPNLSAVSIPFMTAISISEKLLISASEYSSLL